MTRATKRTKKKQSARQIRMRKLDREALELLQRLDRHQMGCVIRAWKETLPHVPASDSKRGDSVWMVQRLIPVLATLHEEFLCMLGNAIIEAVLSDRFPEQKLNGVPGQVRIDWVK